MRRSLLFATWLVSFGAGGAISEGAEISNEAEARMARSVALLTKEGVPINEHLPTIEAAAEVRPRSSTEVALRAMALAVVAVKGETLDQQLTQDLVKRFDIYSAFSPEERAFIDDPAPSEQDRAKFSWRYEALGVMLWALGFSDNLGRPDQLIDVPRSVGILRDHDQTAFLEKAELRPIGEILDQADLIYRYNWAVTEARINGDPPPAGLHPGVVYERHYALNWLIRYEDQEWDNVSTDT